ncbi:MAG: lipopolysaccharide biosynthesis protein [Alphaproteobacteria bacterium]|nr:lipopolysaccharide biosynthesis protein [Alphaproteobacteria bacterium]
MLIHNRMRGFFSPWPKAVIRHDAAGISLKLSLAKDIYGSLARSSIWIIAGRWGSRSIGLLSTVILARLLTPEDFGLVAIASIMVGFAELIVMQGQRLSVVQKADPDTDFINSAWTITVLTGVLFGLTVLLMAPVIANYFGDPRAELVVRVMSLRIFMMGFENIGMVLYIKNLDFRRDFFQIIFEKIFPFIITLSLALYLRNYWALVGGLLVGHMGAIAATYVMHPYRPRICFKKTSEVWSFSGWVLIESLGSYFTMQLDRLFIPSVGSTSSMGHYHVGANLARMPTFEAFVPLNRAFLPAYGRLRDAPGEMINNFVNVLSVAAIICIPISIGFAIVADEAVRFIYGAKWVEMIPVVSWISLNAGVLALLSTFYPVLQASNHPRLAASITFFHAILLLAGLGLLRSRFNTIGGIAMIRMLVSLMIIPFAIFVLRRVIRVSLAQLSAAVWRPLLAVGVISAMLLYAMPDFHGLAIGLKLLIRIASGGAVFALTLVLSWLLAGRPPGAEQALNRFVTSRLSERK